ncbi:MAG: 1,4-beta-xylanase [Lachnospiraceae bacterium]|nr:1,4-beta-xylanase [Lachnospiraceae bacterium]
MDYIKGITFGAFAGEGEFEKKQAYDSLDKLIEGTGANYIVLVPNGLQDTPQSQEIDYISPANLSDSELIKMIEYIHSRGLKVALKPTVNCKNGTWRAHICFFDKDVPCEPKWSIWFKAYTDFQIHYAKIAQKYNVDMFIAGCEMVQSEHRETEWRNVISEVRKVYYGPVTYNTDKYQEDNVNWWDCVDYICSSGYYPINDWDTQLDRIERVVKKYNKPFFFAEAGCKSTIGSKNIPNDWTIQGNSSVEEQAEWYKEMFDAVNKRNFINGFFLWDWSIKLYPDKKASTDKGYDIYNKPAEKIVKAFYASK